MFEPKKPDDTQTHRERRVYRVESAQTRTKTGEKWKGTDSERKKAKG